MSFFDPWRGKFLQLDDEEEDEKEYKEEKTSNRTKWK